MMKLRKVNTLVTSLILIFPIQGMGEQKTEELPSIELLEFLGEWTNEEHKWVDPLLIKDMKTESETKKTTEEGKDD